SGSIGATFGGCCEQVSQEPSSSETRSRLSLNNATSFLLSPSTDFGTGEAGFGRGPGSFALNRAALFCPSTADVTAPANNNTTSTSRIRASAQRAHPSRRPRHDPTFRSLCAPTFGWRCGSLLSTTDCGIRAHKGPRSGPKSQLAGD